MRLRLFQIVSRAQNNDQVSRWYDIFIVTVAFVSIVPLMFKSEQLTPVFDNVLNYIDVVTVYILFADYIFRWITYDIKSGLGKKAFIIYPFTPMAIIDLLAILPSATILHDSFKFLRILRIVRILRMFNGLTIMTNVFIRERKALLSVCFFMCVYVLSVGLIMFTIEPNTFDTFLDALYWSTTALATIGYGDITPVTDLGKFLAIVSSLVGIAIVAFPAGIITGGYITQLQKARKKGIEYFALPVKHDKVFHGRPITKYKNFKDYLKKNKKVSYYLRWMGICLLISIATSLYTHYCPNSLFYFNEFGSVLVSVILEPCAGIIVALVNDAVLAMASSSPYSILTLPFGLLYCAVFGVYFRRGRMVTPKSVLMVLLFCVILNTICITCIYVRLVPDINTLINLWDYDIVVGMSNFFKIDIYFSFVLYVLYLRIIYSVFCIVSVMLVRKFFWGCKIDPMMKIPKRRRYKQKFYIKGKNEHSYIQTWLEENTDEDEDIPEFDAAVRQGKKSIERSRKAIRKKKAEVVEMQQEVEAKIADINKQKEEIAKHEEAIDTKKRAVRRVKRRKIIEESDYIPSRLNNFAIGNDAPGAEGVGSDTGSFERIDKSQSNTDESKKDK